MNISNYFYLTNISLLGEFTIRLIIAAFLGAIIGIERELRSKEAGLRTHILVALGAALVMIVSQYGFFEVIQANIRVDPSRIAAQVVSGVGFLGAGLIFKEHGSIKGLSTAAGVWSTAAIGLAAGSGLYFLAILSTILILIAFELLKRISNKFYNLHIELQLNSTNNSFSEFREDLIKDKTIIVSQKLIRDSFADTINFKIKTRNYESLNKILKKIDVNPNLALDFYEII